MLLLVFCRNNLNRLLIEASSNEVFMSASFGTYQVWCVRWLRKRKKRKKPPASSVVTEKSFGRPKLSFGNGIETGLSSKPEIRR